METLTLTHNGNIWRLKQASPRKLRCELIEGAVGEFPTIDELEILSEREIAFVRVEFTNEAIICFLK